MLREYVGKELSSLTRSRRKVLTVLLKCLPCLTP